MSENVPTDPPAEGLIHEIAATYAKYGHNVDEGRILEASIQALRGSSEVDRRTSTQLIFDDLVATFTSPLLTQFVSGERHAYCRSLVHVTGEAYSGWLQRAADQSEQSGSSS